MGMVSDIRDWCVRASQQALRITGIFHLCENDAPSEGLISEREMDMAVRFMRVAYEQVKASVLFDADRETELCILKIAEWCCSANWAAKVANKEIKDAMRSNSELQRSISPSAGWSILGRWRWCPRRRCTEREDRWCMVPEWNVRRQSIRLVFSRSFQL